MHNRHFSSFYFFYFITVGIVVPYWSLHLQALGFSAAQIGQLMSILLLTKVVAPNVWAAIADKMVMRTGSAIGLLKFATIATLAFYCLAFWAHSFWAVAAVMFGYCVFWNACLPQVEVATLNHLKANTQKHSLLLPAEGSLSQPAEGSSLKYGSIRLWGSVGFIVGVVAVGVLMDYFGTRIIVPSGAVGLLCIVFVSMTMRVGRKQTNMDSARISARAPRLFSVLNWKVMTLLLLCIVMQMTHAPFYTFFSIYLESYNYSKTQIGLIWSTGVIAEIAVFLVGHRLLRHYRLAHLLTFTFAVASLRWFMVAYFPSIGALIFISQLMHAVTYGLYHSIMIQFVDRFFQGAYQIRGQALYSSVTFGIGGAIGTFLSGYIWAESGGNLLFLSAAYAMFLISIISLLITPKITQAS